jgi:tight adherence protein C
MLKQAPKATEGTTASALPGWYRKRLAAAGLSEGAQQNWFAALHASAIATGALGGLWITGGGETLSTAMLIVGGLGAYAGWWAPASWLDARGMQRRVELTTDFPIMLDLVELSLQGGLGLHASWMAVCENLSGSNDAMSEEMRRVDLEVAFGATWTQALAAAAERTGVQEFDALGSLLAQTERFGTEVAQMVKVMSDSLRNEQIEGLEERAHRASVLMVFVLAGMLLPATLLVMMVPVLTMMLESLGKANAN